MLGDGTVYICTYDTCMCQCVHISVRWISRSTIPTSQEFDLQVKEGSVLIFSPSFIEI